MQLSIYFRLLRQAGPLSIYEEAIRMRVLLWVPGVDFLRLGTQQGDRNTVKFCGS